MGDWIYYVTVMPFSEVAKRVRIADEIHKNKGLKDLIQRSVTSRTKGIVEYLRSQEQRFFNSIILGIYGGDPTYQEIDVQKFEGFNEVEIEQLNRTFGILVLSGEEEIFPIDGQHRFVAIRDALHEGADLAGEEVSAIFLAHHTDAEGVIRSRRLFSTLNRYAKPVSKSEIIAIDEEDNGAVITRNLIEDFPFFKGMIAFNKNRSLSPSESKSWTNITVLYDIVLILLTNKKVFGIPVNGQDYNKFTHTRYTEERIEKLQSKIIGIFERVFAEIPSLNSYSEVRHIDRAAPESSLLFRVIGQTIFFSVLKLAMNNKKTDEFFELFSSLDFSLGNPNWRRIFWDEEVGNMITAKTLQKYATKLLAKRLGIDVMLTRKEKELFENFKIDPMSL